MSKRNPVYPWDVLIPGLLRSTVGEGAGVTLPLPSGLSRDSYAAIRNACMIPGVEAIITRNAVRLALVPPGKECSYFLLEDPGEEPLRGT